MSSLLRARHSDVQPRGEGGLGAFRGAAAGLAGHRAVGGHRGRRQPAGAACAVWWEGQTLKTVVAAARCPPARLTTRCVASSFPRPQESFRLRLMEAVGHGKPWGHYLGRRR